MLPGAAAMRGVARFLQNVLQDVEESRRRASPSRGGAVGPPLDRSTASWLSVGSVNSLPDSAGPQDAEDDMPIDPVMQRLLWRVRSQEVRNHVLSAPPAQYIRYHDVRLQALTYNVNGRKPPLDLSLAGWLDPGKGDTAADIVAVAFQELVPLNAGNIITGGEDRAVAAAWVALINRSLNKAGDASDHYVVIMQRQLVGVYLAVFVHRRLLPQVRGTQMTTVATGLGGMLANKGAVVVRMRVYDTGLCFVAAHLASGESTAAHANRLKDIAEIIRRTEFPAESQDPVSDSSVLIYGSGSTQQGRASLVVGPSNRGDWGADSGLLSTSHHHIIFMGDMNFRVALPYHEALGLIREGRLGELIWEDGLIKAREMEPSLSEWREGPITFPPTYKFRLGTNEYAGKPTKTEADRGDDIDADSQDDDKEGEKMRTPSWTDRVLWRSSQPGLTQVAYTCGPQTLSDHRPVAATFLMKAHAYEIEEVSKLVDEGWRDLDLAVMAAMPKFAPPAALTTLPLSDCRTVADMSGLAARNQWRRCELTNKVMDFGNVEFDVAAVRTTLLKNTGSSTVHFRFVETPGLIVDSTGSSRSVSKVAPPWLEVDPLEGVIEEGGEIDIRLTARVRGGPNGSTSAIVRDCQGRLEQVLVLHIAGGSDFFLIIDGWMMPTCFGVPLEILARASGGDEPGEGAVPEPVLQMVDFLLAEGRLKTPGLFLDPDSHADNSSERLPADQRAAAVRRALSSRSPLPDSTDPLDVAAVLLQLFAALPAPLMPESVVQVCEVCVLSREAGLKTLCEGMSPTGWATFCHVVDLACKALEPENARENGLTVPAMSSLLADAWFPPLPDRFGWLGNSNGLPDSRAMEAVIHVAESAATSQQRRVEFVALFLSQD